MYIFIYTCVKLILRVWVRDISATLISTTVTMSGGAGYGLAVCQTTASVHFSVLSPEHYTVDDGPSIQVWCLWSVILGVSVAAFSVALGLLLQKLWQKLRRQ